VGDDIDGEKAGDYYSGESVALSGNDKILAVGASGNDSNCHVRIFELKNGEWAQLGQDIDGEFRADTSDRSVALSGDGSIVAIGAALNDDNGTSAGHVRIFEWHIAALG
jgi:hypothetical protein